MFLFHKRKGIEKTQAPQNGADIISESDLIYEVSNIQGIGKRTKQEDSFSFVNAFDRNAIKDKGLLFVVCDGMGGMRDGKIASEKAVEILRKSFMEMSRESDIVSFLHDSISLASKSIEDILDGEGGSTIVCGLIRDGKLYYASVGDSFIYLKRGDYLYRLNREHNVKNDKYIECIRRGNLDPEIGRMDDESSSLTQFLGMSGFSEMECSVRPISLRENDIVMACSDGVGGVVTESEIRIALNNDSTKLMCDEIERCIIQRNGENQDNYTMTIVKCERN